MIFRRADTYYKDALVISRSELRYLIDSCEDEETLCIRLLEEMNE